MEVAHALQVPVRRNRNTAAFRGASIADLRALVVAIDPETDHQAWAATPHLADRYRLTLYDAAYLELAQRLGLPLATLDRELHAAGSALGVSVLGS